MYTLTALLKNGLSFRTWSAQIADLQRIAVAAKSLAYVIDLHGEVLIDAEL